MFGITRAHLLPLLLFATAAATGAPVVAAERAHPALWTIGDEDTTISLFGTVHVMRPGVDWFHGEVRRSFDAADEVVLEALSLDPMEEQALVMRLGVDESGRGLRSKLEADERARYEDAMRSLGLPTDALDPFEPWMAAVTLAVVPMMQAGYSPELGVDEVLETAAVRAGKTLTGLETPEQQLGFLDAIDEPSQLEMLNETVVELDNIRFAMREMDALWSAGRAEALGAMVQASMTGYGGDAAVYDVLLSERNRVWADWVEARMARPGHVFLAVGAGHLAGDGSLPEQLESKGFAVERVRSDVTSSE